MIIEVSHNIIIALWVNLFGGDTCYTQDSREIIRATWVVIHALAPRIDSVGNSSNTQGDCRSAASAGPFQPLVYQVNVFVNFL
mmetsp:Transcript_37763/g.49717  ORF Transcript_37763/g.49717 Transcript_37763/m.49717 type:complete len:83 (-) Transcript_37763:2389-2637(-)